MEIVGYMRHVRQYAIPDISNRSLKRKSTELNHLIRRKCTPKRHPSKPIKTDVARVGRARKGKCPNESRIVHLMGQKCMR